MRWGSRSSLEGPGRRQAERRQTRRSEKKTAPLSDDGSDHTFAVAVGDRVLTSKYGGTEVKVGDVDYILVDEDDILGIVE